MDDSGIMCDEILKKKQKVTTNFNEKKAICKTRNFYILLGFLLITIALLIKYKAKQKHLLPFYVTNNELKEVLY